MTKVLKNTFTEEEISIAKFHKAHNFCKLCHCSIRTMVMFDCCKEGVCCVKCLDRLYNNTTSTHGMFICPYCRSDVCNIKDF